MILSNYFLVGASSDSVELLGPAVTGQWGSSKTAAAVSSDEGREGDQIFEFDGVNSAVSVPNDVLDHGLSSTFTMATWLKHAHRADQDRHAKEHILCSADDHSKFSSLNKESQMYF